MLLHSEVVCLFQQSEPRVWAGYIIAISVACPLCASCFSVCFSFSFGIGRAKLQQSSIVGRILLATKVSAITGWKWFLMLLSRAKFSRHFRMERGIKYTFQLEMESGTSSPFHSKRGYKITFPMLHNVSYLGLWERKVRLLIQIAGWFLSGEHRLCMR